MVRWGDAGPLLLTKVAEELGYTSRALASCICYPVHYTEAADLLRSSKAASIGQRMGSSLFVHLWNAMLHHAGVQKTSLPPKHSLLRRWIEQHPVSGWTGEYSDEALEHTLSTQTELHLRAEENRILTAEVARKLTDYERQTNELTAGAEEIGRLKAKYREAARQLKQLEIELEISAAENARTRAEMIAVLSSTTWKLTRPIRIAGGRLPWIRQLIRFCRHRSYVREAERSAIRPLRQLPHCGVHPTDVQSRRLGFAPAPCQRRATFS
ncbi:MAG: hypothetical protein QOF19_1115 [Alphaproteobacteria bacterium]|nr:hypothetical protein [Alphaproteobacteria bacterium]